MKVTNISQFSKTPQHRWKVWWASMLAGWTCFLRLKGTYVGSLTYCLSWSNSTGYLLIRQTRLLLSIWGLANIGASAFLAFDRTVLRQFAKLFARTRSHGNEYPRTKAMDGARFTSGLLNCGGGRSAVLTRRIHLVIKRPFPGGNFTRTDLG